MRVRGWKWLVMASVSLVVACASSDPEEPGEAELPGTIEIVVEGLPAQMEAAVNVEGPDGFSEEVGSTTTIEEAEPGSYTVTADEVGGDTIYTPQPEETALELEPDGEEEVVIDYEMVLGDLQVVVEGLPTAAEPELSVVGDDEEWEVPTDGLVEGLEPGLYTVMPEVYEDETGTYAASEVDASVVSGEVAEAAVEYLQDTGSLDVEVRGLPAGVPHEVDVVGEDGTRKSLPQSGQMAALEEGVYELEPQPVEVGPVLYEADGESVAIEKGETTSVTIDYEEIAGQLPVEISGLELDEPAQVQLVGAEETVSVSEEDTYEVPPGDYGVEVSEVKDGGTTYEDGGTVSEFVVESGENDPLVVEYELVTASLTVDIAGQLDGNSSQVEVTGPDDFEETVADGGQIFPSLVPGEYTVSAGDVEDGAAIYVPSGSETLVLDSGDVETVEIVYERQIGDIDVVITEYGDVDFEIAMEGPAGTQTFDDDASFEVDPGIYTLSATAVPEDGLGNQGYVQIEPDDFDVEHGDWVTVDVEVAPGYLVTTGADDGNGSLREVAGGVVDGTVVRFADGVEEVVLGADPVEVESSIEIYGGDAGVVVEGGQGGIFAVGTWEVVEFDGLTLRGGDAYQGGAIDIGLGAQVAARNIVFDENDASGSGGAVYVGAGAELIARDAVFRDNESDGSGGAVFVEVNGEVDVRRVVFEGNTAALHGGAVATTRTEDSDVFSEFEAVLFDGNIAGFDSGALDVSGVSRVAESTFIENEANSRGGAVRIWDGEMTILGATITENEANYGGGIEHRGDDDTDLELGRSIVAGNTASVSGDDIDRELSTGEVETLGYNVVGVGADGLEDGQEGDQVGTESDPLDPELEALADNGGFSKTMAPQSGSPAYAPVPAEQCVAMDEVWPPLGDQRGEYRPAGAFCNAGAYERDTTVEDFGEAEMSRAAYQYGSFDGVDGIEWHYEEVRRQISDGDNYYIGDTSLMLHGDRDSKLYAEGIPGGAESLSVLVSQGFTEDGERTLDLYVDGEYVDTSPDVEIDTGAEQPPYPVFVFAVEELDVSGDFDVELRASGTHQVVVDFVSWR